MAEKRNTLTTPAGTAGWVAVNKPSTKFKEAGEYSVKLILPPDEAATLQSQFTPLAEQARADYIAKEPKKAAIIGKYALHVPGEEEMDAEGNPTGNIVFAFKQTAVITPRDKKKSSFEVKIGIFDAKGNPMPADKMVGRGSKLKVAYEIVPFKMDATKKVGISLRLRAVQVLELVEYSGGNNDAGSFGFGQEDGYTGEGASDSGDAGDADGDQTNVPATAVAKNGDF